MKALVSFVRAYSKHEASYIFRLQNLDLVGTAKSFGLLKLPKMPELKGKSIEGWGNANVDVCNISYSSKIYTDGCKQWSTFAYADKVREAQRQASFAAESAPEVQKKRDANKRKREELKERNAAWSRNVERKSEKEKRKEKKEKRKAWLKTQNSDAQGSAVGEKSSLDDDDDDGDDWDELAREERLAKKVKKGAMDSRAFDEEFTGF